MKRKQPVRDWKDARAKIDAEGQCRLCGITRGLQCAHIVGRKFDRPQPGKKTLWVNPDSVLALCPPCHGAYDRHEVSILHRLSEAEQWKALEDLRTIEAVRIRTDPEDYVRTIQDARREARLGGV